MPTKKKSWREKHDRHAHPAKVTTLDKSFGGFEPGATLVIATPVEVSDFFRGVRKARPVQSRNCAPPSRTLMAPTEPAR